MKYLFRTSLLLILFLLINVSAWSQFVLSAEIRPRLEFNHGYSQLFGPELKPGVVFSQRSRLTFDYTHKIFETKLSIQDVRIWGDETQLSSADAKGVSLHEAWGKVKFKEFFYFKLGRQELSYDDQRLLGSVNWAQQARSHDAVVFGFEKEDWKLHIAGAYNNDAFDLSKTPYSINGYRALSFFWVNKTIKEKFKLSFIGIANGIENATDTTLYFTGTFGPHLEYKSKAFATTATFYYQTGKNTNNITVSSFLAAATASYKVKATNFKIGIDFLSGTNALNNSNSKQRTFNTLYATNHKFYGFMDYFINIPAHTANGGLIDLQLGMNSEIGEKSSILVNTHYFLSANNVADPNNLGNALSRSLGGEIDAVYNLKIHEMVSFSLGWSVLIPTNSLDVINAGTKGRFNTWAWTAFTFKPIFFKSKEKEETSL